MAGRARLPLAGLAVAGIAVALSACASERALLCGSDELYREAQAAPPLRIPDDLSIPDETESLRVPDPLPAAASETSIPPECLEATPVLGGTADPAS